MYRDAVPFAEQMNERRKKSGFSAYGSQNGNEL
jgi:hypothetical protein